MKFGSVCRGGGLKFGGAVLFFLSDRLQSKRLRWCALYNSFFKELSWYMRKIMISYLYQLNIVRKSVVKVLKVTQIRSFTIVSKDITLVSTKENN